MYSSLKSSKSSLWTEWLCPQRRARPPERPSPRRLEWRYATHAPSADFFVLFCKFNRMINKLEDEGVGYNVIKEELMCFVGKDTASSGSASA